MVYLRDVAQVRDGNPPQTNIVRVNGRKVDIPSYLVRPGQEISLLEEMRNNQTFLSGQAVADKRERLAWLVYSPETLSGHMTNVPPREEIPLLLNEHVGGGRSPHGGPGAGADGAR